MQRSVLPECPQRTILQERNLILEILTVGNDVHLPRPFTVIDDNEVTLNKGGSMSGDVGPTSSHNVLVPRLIQVTLDGPWESTHADGILTIQGLDPKLWVIGLVLWGEDLDRQPLCRGSLDQAGDFRQPLGGFLGVFNTEAKDAPVELLRQRSSHNSHLGDHR